MTDPFSDPTSAAGIDLEELKGRLLLIKPLRLEVGINTAFGSKDATVADVHVLDGDQAGEHHSEVFLWPKVLQSQISSSIGSGRFSLGRLTQGTAKPGQKPPWKLDIAADADKELARKYLASDKYKQNTTPVAAPAEDPWGKGSDDPPF